MAIDLLTLEPQQISRDLKGKFTLLYGDPKVGKTTLASEIDNVLIASFEMGSNALHNVRVVPMQKWKDWKDTVRQLVRDRDKEVNGKTLQDTMSTIAVDTVDEAYKLCEKWVCQREGVENIRDIPWGGGYKMVDEEFMAGFRELAFNGYGLFFISHSVEKTMKDDSGKEYNKIVPALPNRPYNLINKMVDTIAYLRQIPVQIGETIEQRRYLFFRGDDRFLAGSRFHYIVPRIELSYPNLVKAICDAVDAEVEHKGGTATDEANPYTQRDFDGMMDEAKQVWGKVVQADKTEQALAVLNEEFGKPTKFSEILPDQIDQFDRALSRIKELV